MMSVADAGAATATARIAAIADRLRLEATARAVDPIDLAAHVIAHYERRASLGIDRARMPDDPRPMV